MTTPLSRFRTRLPMLPNRCLALLLLALAVSGCSPTGIAEGTLQRELPRVIGPADAYTVDVTGLNARTGEADRVTIQGVGVRPEGAPVLRRLDVDLRDLQVSRATKKLTRVGSAHTTARIAPGDLAAFLNQRDDVRDASVTLRPPDGLTLRLRPVVRGLTIPGGTVEATGQLVAADGVVRFDVETVRALGVGLGSAVARRLADAVNPVADLTRTRAHLRVTGVRIEGGMLVLDGEADLLGASLKPGGTEGWGQ